MDCSETKSFVPRLTFSMKAGIQMVDIRVGEELKLFRIHRSLLCTRVPYFAKMFNGGFVESRTNSAVLGDDLAEVFDVLAEWVYTNRLPPSLGFWYPVEAYIFADKICLPEFMDMVMDRIQTGYPLMPSDALNIYRRQPTSSRLRLFAIDLTVFEFSCAKHGISSSLVDTITKNEDFATDFLSRVQSHVRHPMIISNPKKSNDCTYHCHEDSGKCPRTEKLQR